RLAQRLEEGDEKLAPLELLPLPIARGRDPRNRFDILPGVRDDLPARLGVILVAMARNEPCVPLDRYGQARALPDRVGHERDPSFAFGVLPWDTHPHLRARR